MTAADAGNTARVFGFGFTADTYNRMAEDTHRLGAYARAIAKAVAGKAVLDLGTGRDALLAKLCVDAGASSVTAVEVVPTVASRARAALASAGLDERVEVLEGHSAAVRLPPVDIVVHEIVGDLAMEEGVAAVVKDLQGRPEVVDACSPGWSLPRRVETRVAPVALGQPEGVGLPTSSGARIVRLPRPPPWESLLGPLQTLDAIDTGTPVELQQERCMHWRMGRAAALTGFVCAPWLDLDGEHFVDAWAVPTSWRHKMVTLKDPATVHPGDEVTLRARVDLRHFPVVYSFSVELRRCRGSTIMVQPLGGEIVFQTCA